MKRQGLFLAGLFLAAALVTPLATRTSATPQVSVRIYDRDHKDYHNWDDNEARAYEGYRHDHTDLKVTFGKNNRKQQSAYWNWRHEHPDNR
jgi:hypothetical protein